jgi:hypothetical protein
LEIVEVERHVHVQMLLAEKAIDVVTDREIFIESHEIDAVQIGRNHFRLFSQWMVRMNTHN